MEKRESSLLITDGEKEIPLTSILSGIIRHLKDKDVVEKSKGKAVVGEFLEELMDQNDPFVRALGTLGSDQTINALGVLLFVAFQLGYTFGSEKYTLEIKESSDPNDDSRPEKELIPES